MARRRSGSREHQIKLINHTAFRRATERLQACLDIARTRQGGEPACLAVVGASGTGKTRLVQLLRSRHPRVVHERYDEVPVHVVDVPASPTIKNLASEIIKGLGVPPAAHHDEGRWMDQVKKLINECRILVLVLDEFQHLIDKGNYKVLHQSTTDWLKLLIKQTSISIVVCGLPRCLTLLDSNEQFAGLFRSQILLPRFEWKDDGLREEFLTVVDTLAEWLEAPQLAEGETPFRLYCASSGLMRPLIDLVREADRVVARTSSRLDLEVLQSAYDEVIYLRPGAMKRPFDSSIQLVPTLELLERVDQYAQNYVVRPSEDAQPIGELELQQGVIAQVRRKRR